MGQPTPWGEDLAAAVPDRWARLLGDETLHHIDRIGKALAVRSATETVLPGPERVFRAFDTSPENVGVIILGQDPYPTPGHATGLAFSVPRSVWPLPPTLQNILKELTTDIGVSPPRHGNLHSWQRQGVLLLNRHLTTAAHRPGAHRQLGWAQVTDHIVARLAETNPKRVLVAWGKEAQQVIPRAGTIPTVVSPHPSPLSASRGFFGSRPFSRVNEYRVAWGENPIDWNLDPEPGCQPG